MEEQTIKETILELYDQSKETGERGLRSEVVYKAINKTISVNIDNDTFIIPFNVIADDPNITKEKASAIKLWAR